MKAIIFLFCFSISFVYGQQDTILNPPVDWSMEEKTDTLTMRDLRHAGSRWFPGGASYQWIANAHAQQNLSLTVDNALTIFTAGDPLAYHIDETVTPLGSTWITDGYAATDQNDQHDARMKSFSAHQFGTTIIDTTITSMMTLFMIERFGTKFGEDARANYDFYRLLSDNCLGDFRQLIKDVGVHPVMLHFLNGNLNVASNPQENYAREVMELFGIGKIETGIPEDFGNYMESDVPEVAKACTGYSTINMRSQTSGIPSSVFTPANHDNTTKNLSSHFGNAVITPAGIAEYDNFVDIMFAQPNALDNFCENLYTFFVYDGATTDGLPDEVYDSIIPVMVQTMIDSNFQIRPVLAQLFKSRHFYDIRQHGGLIKSPVNFVASMMHPMQSYPNFSFDINYAILYKIVDDYVEELGMDITTPPDVAGWLAFYQGPSKTKYWINTALIYERLKIVNSFIGGNGVNVNGNLFQPDFLGFVDSLPGSLDPNTVIDNMVLVFLAKDIDSTQKTALKLVLTNGQPDFEWTDEYGDYLANPTDPVLADPVRDRIKATLLDLMKRYDFHAY